MAGTGSNSTQEAIERTKHAEHVGAAASLQVCPYYNRPTQDGILAHFEAIAKATKLPLFIYNIPSRTGRLIEAKTMIELSKIDNIIGMKDACGDMMITMDIMRGTRGGKKKFYVLCGEDALTFSMMGLGGDGGIMAVANVIGKEYYKMIHLMLDGHVEEAREIHLPDPSRCPGAVHRVQPGSGQGSHEHDGRSGGNASPAAGPAPA